MLAEEREHRVAPVHPHDPHWTVTICFRRSASGRLLRVKKNIQAANTYEARRRVRQSLLAKEPSAILADEDAHLLEPPKRRQKEKEKSDGT